MNVACPPFSAASGVQSMVLTGRSSGSPVRLVIVTPVGRTSAMSPSWRKTTLSVWARMAATSLARKLSSPLRPTTSGTLWRAPMRRLRSPRCITTSAYAPSTRPRASRTAAERSPW